jgi:type II secretory ATPase GspE/PulE/Tfp pilus assembly ATPase PilB-like protein
LLYDKLDAPFGLVMISGPTGSGKTTTLYSCLSYIDKKTKNVLTVEDPVEYRLKGVHQMQVNEKIGLTFASGLRTILRQDPDVIMVGECRDGETAGMAIQAALTGHIVFSTIHTNDAVGVIPRLIDMGVEPFLVANSVSLCIAQRLVRRICRHCQTPEEGQSVLERLHNDAISDERLAALGIVVDPDLTYVTGRGCVHCRNTGYQGRQAVFEIFEIDQDARAEIVSPTFDANVMRRRARERGMTTLIGHGLMLIDEGMTTHSEVVRVLGEAY